MSRSIEAVNAELNETRTLIARHKKLSAQRVDLWAQEAERRERERETAQILAREQGDVEKLSRMSFTSLLASLKGDRDEQLSREKREELAAALQHDQAVRALEDIGARLKALTQELSGLADGQARYQRLLAEKAELIRAAGGTDGARLATLEEEQESLRLEIRELDEAATAGQAALCAMDRMTDSLSSAENWGQWDMLGGGLLTTMAKHEHIDEARDEAAEVQMLLSSFRTELADVSVTDLPEVQVGEFETFADYFFDGLFADWAVQSEIHDSQSSVERARSQTEQILYRLSERKQELGDRLAALEQERDTLLDPA